MQRQIIGQDITSSRTHHILQASATLNRRYVRRLKIKTPSALHSRINKLKLHQKNPPFTSVFLMVPR